MTPDSYDRWEHRIRQALRRMGTPSEVRRGASFDSFSYRKLIDQRADSFFSCGLSQYPLYPAGQGAPRYELHLIGETGCPIFFDALFEIGERLLEIYSEGAFASPVGHLVESKTLQRAAGKDAVWAFEGLVSGWSVWLPEDLAIEPGKNGEDDLLFIDLTPVTRSEAELFLSDREAFENMTMIGKIDLLDFRRADKSWS